MRDSWYTQSQESVIDHLKTSKAGLTAEEAARRLTEYGRNTLKGKKKTAPLIMFLRQFISPLIYILFAAALVSLATEHYIDAAVIFAVLLLNAIIGFIQEIRAEKAMDALVKLASPRAKVKRNGKISIIPAAEVVPGDILVLEAGDRVAADARLLEISSLKINESILTGESMPVDKHTEMLQENVILAERKNLVYMNTVVTYGKAVALVTETGMSTEIGKIATAMHEIIEEKTPLQQAIDKLSKYIIVIVSSTLILLALAGWIQGLNLLEIFFLVVAAAVSAIPEGLPAVVTVVLTMGMRIMAQHNAVVRRLVAVETLGSASVICSDKTGTLTLNEMTVRRLYVKGRFIEVTGEGYQTSGKFQISGKYIDPAADPDLQTVLRIGAICNDAFLTREETCCSIIGDPTEGSLVVAAAKSGLDKEQLENEYPRIDEIPFQSENQYMATLHAGKQGRIIYFKGAVEKTLSMSRYILKNGEQVPLTHEKKQSLLIANNTLAMDGMRVIAMAYTWPSKDGGSLHEDDLNGKLTYAGLVAMEDPPREEAREAIRLCGDAGIKVVMITGDHKLTAESIARQLNMQPGKVITGNELKLMGDAELSNQVEAISVFARIDPLDKLRIVNAFKSGGYTVAMTGDGVNDAPALKSADIGIAMGISGTEVAKEASDMVLTDDNFATIVSAVEEGRAIFSRLRNVIFFLLSTNLGEIFALILSLLIVGKSPLLAVQIIWVNLVTDTTCSIPLGLEPKTGDDLKNPPRHPRVGLIYPGLLLRIAFMATLLGTGVFIVFDWAQQRMSLEEARTLAFCTMVAFEWFRAFNARSDEFTVFKLGLFRNRWLLISIGIAVCLQIAVVYTPFLQVAFGTVPIPGSSWGIAILAGALLFILEEFRKAVAPNLFSFGKWAPVRRSD